MKNNDTQGTHGNDLTIKKDLEANLLAIIENSDGLVYSMDRDLRYIMLNGVMKKRIKDVFGIDAKPGDSIHNFLKDIDPQASEYWKSIYSLGLKGESLQFVKEFNYSGDQQFWSFSVNPIRQNGEITGLSCFARDVTDLRKSRLAVEASEKKYRLMFNSTPLPSWIYDVDTLKFIDVNDAALNHYGYSREEFLNSTIRQICPPKDLDKLMQMVQGSRHVKMTNQVEIQHIKKNGEIIDVSVLTCPITMDGQTNVLVLAEDITDKKKAAADLRESEERYRLVSENPLLGVGWASLSGEVLYVNKTFSDLLGYCPDELKGMHYASITHPQDFEWEAALFEKIIAGETDHYKVEKRYTRKDGRYIWAELNLSRVNNATGQEYCIGIIQDISQRKEVEEAIQKLNEELEDQVQRRTEQLKAAYAELESFSYSVSHDLRSPLRLINGFVKILAQDMADRLKPSEREYLEIIGEKVVRMDGLIRDMLKLSVVDKTDLVRDEVDMHTMVVNILEELSYTMAENRAAIRVIELPEAFGDHGLVKQVWTNLISNAIKYSSRKSDPRIEIGATLIDGKVTYYVRDNGAGFDMRHAHKLFGAFQRLHDSSDFEGTGVGLALVKRIITKHGGRIWADARVNSGATFYFCLS